MGNWSQEKLRSLTLEEIETKLRGSAKQWAYRSKGRAHDQEMEVLLPALRLQAAEFLELNHSGYIYPDWLEEGETILRNVAYGKLPRPFPPDEEVEEDDARPFTSDDKTECKIYAEAYLDSLANEFISRAQKCHLAPDLTAFAIRVLQAAMIHARMSPPDFYCEDEIAAYLSELQKGSGTYREPVRPRGKPGPKPRLEVIEHAGERMTNH